MYKKTGFLLLYLILTQCSNNQSSMERPLHSYNLSFQSEEFRKLSMDGSYNSRELGGYKTTDGKSVKWGVLFRSDKLSDISLEDQKYLKNLGIQRIVDFRSKAEKAEDPDKIGCVCVCTAPVISGDATDVATKAPSTNSFFSGFKTKPETKEESILSPVLKTSLVFFAGLPSVISLTPSAKFNI